MKKLLLIPGIITSMLMGNVAFASGINTNNTSELPATATEITAIEADISTNATGIATNVSGISSNAGDITTNTSGISTNAGVISTNAGNITTNATAITAVEGTAATNASGIATNVSGIATNVSGISTNAGVISTNAGNITTNATAIGTNLTSIGTLNTTVSGHTTGINTNTSGIATNVTNISTNATDIATNTASLSSKDTDIATNTTNIATNVTDIGTNASGIATNVTNIGTNATNIALNIPYTGATGDANLGTYTLSSARVAVSTAASGEDAYYAYTKLNGGDMFYGLGTDNASLTIDAGGSIITTQGSGTTGGNATFAGTLSASGGNFTVDADGHAAIAADKGLTLSGSGYIEAAESTEVYLEVPYVYASKGDMGVWNNTADSDAVFTWDADSLVYWSGIDASEDQFEINLSNSEGNNFVMDNTGAITIANLTVTSLTNTDVAANTSGVSTNAAGIATNVTDIGTNATDIATIESTISSKDAVIAANTSGVSTNAAAIASNDTDIATNVTNIATNATDIALNVPYSGATGNVSLGVNSFSALGISSAGTISVESNNTDAFRVRTETQDEIFSIDTVNKEINIGAGIATNLITSGLIDGVDVFALATTVGTNTSDISDNFDEIALNYDDITSNDTDIAANATAAAAAQTTADGAVTDAAAAQADATSALANAATNVSGIATNVTNIATNVTDIATNVTSIGTNATAIAGKIDGVGSSQDKGIVRFDGTTGKISDASGFARINDGSSFYTGNVTPMDVETITAFYAATAGSGTRDFLRYENTDTTDVMRITYDGSLITDGTITASNVSGTNTGDQDISGIATNASGISTNATAISGNTTDISTNTSGIATNVTNIATNVTNIATNVTNISTNALGIATNVTDIGTNATDIATIESTISSKDAVIAANTSGVATNVTDIATNATDIATNVTAIGAKVPYTGATGDVELGDYDLSASKVSVGTLVGADHAFSVNTKANGGNMFYGIGTDNSFFTIDADGDIIATAGTTGGLGGGASFEGNLSVDGTSTMGDTLTMTGTAEIIIGADGWFTAPGISADAGYMELYNATTGQDREIYINGDANSYFVGTDFSDSERFEINATNSEGNDFMMDNTGAVTIADLTVTNLTNSVVSGNTTDIATNATDISTNAGNITTNASGISTNVTDIATNVTDIATNVTDIASNATAIALKADIASPTFTGTVTAPVMTLTDQLSVSWSATATSATTSDETIVGVSDTSAARTITLATNDVVAGRVIIIKDESGAAGTNNITIATEGAQTIDGAASIDISVDYGVLRLYSNGTQWFSF